jgi:NAD(P)-dependent dehydrogenase (short-subunit alcohol dehydrogenase family)
MSSGRLQDKVAIVSGAGSRGPMPGTGQATAILFARQGAKVLLIDLDVERAEQTRATIESEGGAASVFQADVAKEADRRVMIELCLGRYGRLDVLFNNVGGIGIGKVTDIEADDLDRALAVNLKASIYTSKHAIPAMIASGGGSIINVSSIDGIRAGWSRNLPYAVAKAGINQLTRVTAVHHGRDNIRVNCIAPGHLHAPFVADITPEKRELRRKAGPLGLEGDAWDVAWAAVFLASDESRWISGVVLPVDAGLLAATPLAVFDNLIAD